MPSSPEEPGPKTRISLAVLLAGTGVYLFVIGLGVIPVEPGSIRTAPWVVSACGVMVICAGFLLAITATPGTRNAVLPPTAPLALRLSQSALALIVIGAMSAISGWIAFGEGERKFSSAISIAGFSGEGSSDELSGRIVFGAAAVTCGVAFVVVAWWEWRKLFARRDD